MTKLERRSILRCIAIGTVAMPLHGCVYLLKYVYSENNIHGVAKSIPVAGVACRWECTANATDDQLRLLAEEALSRASNTRVLELSHAVSLTMPSDQRYTLALSAQVVGITDTSARLIIFGIFYFALDVVPLTAEAKHCFESLVEDIQSEGARWRLASLKGIETI